MSWAKNYSWRKSNFAQLKISFWRRGPTGIKCRQAFALLEGVCGWMGMGPRGRGRGRIATPWPLPRVSEPCGNGILSEKERPRYTVSYAFKKSHTTTERPFSLPREYWMKVRCDSASSNVLNEVCHRKIRANRVRGVKKKLPHLISQSLVLFLADKNFSVFSKHTSLLLQFIQIPIQAPFWDGQ